MSSPASPSNCLASNSIMRCRWTVVSAVVRGCNYHIKALRHIRPRLDLNTAKMIAQGIVAARLDYCNSLMCGMSTRNLCRLQNTQNTLARAVCNAPWSTSTTELRRSLHWLPFRQCIDYKTARSRLGGLVVRRTSRHCCKTTFHDGTFNPRTDCYYNHLSVV